MYRRLIVLCLMGGALLLSGCVTGGGYLLAGPRFPPPDAVTRPALADFLKSVTNPTIVLRVPAPQARVAQAQSAQGSAEMNAAYNSIEKGLVKAGFTVRDRGLLEEILRSSQNLDYRVIEQRIDAQLILEIVSISPRAYNNNEYTQANNGLRQQLPYGEFAFDGWQFECKVILVHTGEIGAMYTIHIAPPPATFLIVDGKIRNVTKSGLVDDQHSGYALSLDQASAVFVDRLIAVLNPNPPARLGVEMVALTPEVLRRIRAPRDTRGVLIVSVEPDTRGFNAGLQPDDVIQQLNDQQLGAPVDLQTAVRRAGGEAFTLTVIRRGNTITVKVPAAGQR